MSSAQRQQQQRLMARIKNVIGTGTVTGATTGMLQIRTATGRTNDRIKRVHNYGFMSRPLPEAKAYNLFIGGVTARGITVNVEDERYQIDLKPGEVAMLDDKGNLVHFTEEGIKLKAPTKIVFDTPLSEFAGDVDIKGKATGGSGEFGGIVVETHKHPCNCGLSEEPVN
ncbi:baseplate assembly protein [Vibrio genomosp. F10 str. ZF-129]|uniref:Baseplate assembly protein n=1 Tax=Vibrio genomosp. F10 str. ZF-129 TaxID=1187848 RepID=A0A1E5BA08_9VIBR|nr:phage baseplate assembly protein [Vibrio genomosp. F10]OEE30742.1 baseplate assembly protein [Vibrio genomosp. F10 str. ZF-129]